MKIWMYVDQFATLDSSPEEEYDEIRAWIKAQLPDVKLQFKQDVDPYKLKNARCDVYLFDIGGLCYVDHSGEKRISLCHEVLRQVEDHPNTLFVPWTSMTRDYLRAALQDLLPEFESSHESPKANVWCPGKKREGDWDNEARGDLAAKLKEWSQ
jgi:hypothetical protein